jgi:hypothetical protein
VGLQPPSEVVTMLGWLGFSWPEGDEEKMYQVGQAWLDLAGQLSGRVAGADAAAQQVWAGNHGEAIEAFRSDWTGERSPRANLLDAAEGATKMGAGMILCAGIVLALKINVIVQVVIFIVEVASAVAEAAVTFGASLLEIPVFREITKLILDQLLGMALEMILNQ